MNERYLGFHTTNWVGKDDLLYCRPDLKERIKALEDGDIAAIADKVGEALQESYWTALEVILSDYFGAEKSAADESPEDGNLPA